MLLETRPTNRSRSTWPRSVLKRAKWQEGPIYGRLKALRNAQASDKKPNGEEDVNTPIPAL